MKEIKSSEKEVCRYLNIPSIPNKEKNKWNGKSSFKRGVALVKRMTSEEDYVCCTYNSETDEDVRVIKDFGRGIFTEIIEVYPIPAYMDDNIGEMDLDEDSKEAVQELIQEKKEMIGEGLKEEESLPEWGYDFIHDKQEAIAFLRTKQKKGKISDNEEVLKMKLKVMRQEENNKQD